MNTNTLYQNISLIIKSRQQIYNGFNRFFNKIRLSWNLYNFITPSIAINDRQTEHVVPTGRFFFPLHCYRHSVPTGRFFFLLYCYRHSVPTGRINKYFNYQLSTFNFQLLTINYQLSTINYQLSIINYQCSCPPSSSFFSSDFR